MKEISDEQRAKIVDTVRLIMRDVHLQLNEQGLRYVLCFAHPDGSTGTTSNLDYEQAKSLMRHVIRHAETDIPIKDILN